MRCDPRVRCCASAYRALTSPVPSSKHLQGNGRAPVQAVLPPLHRQPRHRDALLRQGEAELPVPHVTLVSSC